MIDDTISFNYKNDSIGIFPLPGQIKSVTLQRKLKEVLATKANNYGKRRMGVHPEF